MTHTTLAELRRDHETIEILARRLSEMLDSESRPASLSTTLGHLLQAVDDHLAREDMTIYTLALNAQPGISRDMVRQVRDEFERLKENWRDYLIAWTPEAIAADRDAFVRASRAMLPRLRGRVQLEEDLLVAIALQNESGVRGAMPDPEG